jgi:membrane-anchored protein YejM (alkaline phosphatase superfamily)
MKAASIADIKKELQHHNSKALSELCMRLAKYKKENKAFLSFLLFDAQDINVFVSEIKEEISEQLETVKQFSNLYYVKKGLRKILRQLSVYSKYFDDKAHTLDLYIHFCKELKNSGITFKKSQLLINLYEQQLKKVDSLLKSIHEDIRADYANEITDIQNY